MNEGQRRAQRRFIYMNGETNTASAAVQPQPCILATRSVTSRSIRSLCGEPRPQPSRKLRHAQQTCRRACRGLDLHRARPGAIRTPSTPKASASQQAPAVTSVTTVKADTTAVKQARHVSHFHGARLVHATHVKYVHHVKHVNYAHHIKRVKFAHHVTPANTHNANAATPSGPAPAKVTIRSAAKSGVN